MAMNPSRLTRIIFNWDKALNDLKAVKSWSSELRDILDHCNYGDLYDKNDKFSLNLTISNIKEKLFHVQRSELELECKRKPKLRTFMLFKNFTTTENPYISKPLSFFQRKLIGKLRLGCLPLRIETGRYAIPKLEPADRTCLVCLPTPDSQDEVRPVEDESHFLFSCTLHSEVRKDWYAKMGVSDEF